MIWASILVGQITSLVLIGQDAMTRVKYKDEAITLVVTPLAHQQCPTFIFMEDNARPHLPHVVTAALQDNVFTCMDWPALSPEYN